MSSLLRPRDLDRLKAPTVTDLRLGTGLSARRSNSVVRRSLHIAKASCIDPLGIGKSLECEKYRFESIFDSGRKYAWRLRVEWAYPLNPAGQ
jgi:hypothetical protein